jgi:hypothetical protein
MPNRIALQTFETLRDAYPRFYAWVSSNQDVITEFDPGRWESPDWQRRVTPRAVTRVFGRPMPKDYFRFLRAYCYAEERKRLLGIESSGGMHVYPREAARLAEGEEAKAITVFRYDAQPEEFYPFAVMGVDGVSYNFYFDGDDFVVVYFSPMDFDDQVPFCYPDMDSFLIDQILGSLDRIEPDAVRKQELEQLSIRPEFREGTCLDCAVVIKAFKLRFTQIRRELFQDECMNRVRSLVRSGKMPLLRQWVL